jgi:hypothetical protein
MFNKVWRVVVEQLNEWIMMLIWDRSVDLHRERSPNVVSLIVSVKDRTVVGPPVFLDFATDRMLWYA